MKVKDIRIKPFKCLTCGSILANTDGQELITDDFTMGRTVTVKCRKCGTNRVWKPTNSLTSL